MNNEYIGKFQVQAAEYIPLGMFRSVEWGISEKNLHSIGMHPVSGRIPDGMPVAHRRHICLRRALHATPLQSITLYTFTPIHPLTLNPLITNH